HPKVVWVGTGEAWTRNSVSIGDGVCRSVDGGENWTNLGLKESEHIAKIVVDPSETNTVYVCVPGKLWSDSDERGVYKTTDGGKTWVKVLKGSNLSTGCSMLSLDRTNPKTIFAGMWDFRRKGWTFRSGGDGPDAPSGSGLFKSSDGGASWTELSGAKGLPSLLLNKPLPQEQRRRGILDRAERRQGAAVQAVGPRGGRRGAVQAKRGVRVHRGSSPDQRAVSLRRRRPDVGSPRSQPEHDLAALLLRQPDRRSQEREPHLQAGRATDRQHRRRTELQQHLGRRARRLPRRVDRSQQHRPPDHRRRRRRVVFVRRGQQMVEGGQSSDLPVLPCECGHGPAVPRVWRAAGQQLLGRRVGISRRRHQQPLGEHVRGRR